MIVHDTIKFFYTHELQINVKNIIKYVFTINLNLFPFFMCAIFKVKQQKVHCNFEWAFCL